MTNNDRTSAGSCEARHACGAAGRVLPLVLLCLALPGPASAQSAAPRVAVVLSGGGAKGLAHVGVLRVLEQSGIEPEIVTGASMGALLGALYAIGYSPATLDSLVTTLHWSDYFSDAPEPRFLSLDRRFGGDPALLDLPLEHGRITLPSGVISGQRISELLARLTWPAQLERDFRLLPRAFAATATDLETGETVLLDHGSLASALRASMSIPTVLAPIRLDGRLLIDGGISRNLPAREARELGADVIICSDVSDQLLPAVRLRSLLDVLLQTMAIYMAASNAAERPLCDVYIRPDIQGLTAADFDRAAEWIERGARAARAAAPELGRVARASPGTRPAPLRAPDTVHVSAIEVEGLSGAAAGIVRTRLRLRPDGSITLAQLDTAVKRAYATELFERVEYRLDLQEHDTVVVVSGRTREQDRVGLGIRYDDLYKASLLLTVKLRNRIGFGSVTELDARLGEQLNFGVRHLQYEAAGTPLVAGLAGSYSRTPIPIYGHDHALAEVRVQVAGASALLGIPLGERGALGILLKAERARTGNSIGFDSSTTRSYVTVSLRLRESTLDRTAFPTRGHQLSLQSEHALAGTAFRQQIASALIALPLRPRTTALLRATVGQGTRGDALPLPYRFMLGGTYPTALFPETQVTFAGLRPQQRSGSAAARLGASVQWEASPNVFAGIRGDAGFAAATLNARARWESGFALTLGVLSVAGPAELSLAGRRGARPHLELSIGHQF